MARWGGGGPSLALTFQGWPILSASMQASSGTCGRTGDGNLLIHRSSTNGIILATLKRPAATHYATPFSQHPATPTEPLDCTARTKRLASTVSPQTCPH